MHTEKQKIFDEYAKEQGYKDWEAIIWEFECHLSNANELNLHIFAACDLVQKEQQKRIAENMNWDRCKNKGNECRTDKHENSILSENNLIK
jgi:hypothetical protein